MHQKKQPNKWNKIYAQNKHMTHTHHTHELTKLWNMHVTNMPKLKMSVNKNNRPNELMYEGADQAIQNKLCKLRNNASNNSHQTNEIKHIPKTNVTQYKWIDQSTKYIKQVL